MPLSRPAAAPPVLALMLAAGLGLAGCAGNDGHGSEASSLSGLRDKSESMLKVGDSARINGDCPAAIRFYQLVKDDGKHADVAAARIGAGDCELSMNALPDAERDYRKAMELAPNNPAPLVGLGRVYLVSHRPGEAAGYFEQALKKNADAAFVWNDEGVAYDQLRRHKDAQEAYRAGLAKYPNDQALRNNLALSLAMSRDFAAAETLLRGLAAEPGASSRTRENLALVLGLEGKTDEARRIAQTDLNGAALDNNARFYQYARAVMTGGPLPSQTATAESDDAAAAPAARAEPPLPPPVLATDRPLHGLRGPEPSAAVTKPAIAKTDLPPPADSAESAAITPPAPAAAKPTQTAALPSVDSPPPAKPAAIAPPTRIVARDSGALKTEPVAKATGPVASSENQ